MNNTATVIVDFLQSTIFVTVIVWGAAVIGCSSSTSQPLNLQQSSAHPLGWVENAVVQNDLAKAVDREDFRLLAFSGRRVTVPGVDAAEINDLEETCGLRILPGTGDALESEADRLLRSKALHYATEYNASILAHCKRDS